MYTIDRRVAGLVADMRGDMAQAKSRLERFRVFDGYVEYLKVVEADNDALAVVGKYDAVWHEGFCAIHQAWSLCWEMYTSIVKP